MKNTNIVVILLVVAVSVGFGLLFAYAVHYKPDPCKPYTMEKRQTYIESHERCMVEENCIYEAYDIRIYDLRVEQQELCRVAE